MRKLKVKQPLCQLCYSAVCWYKQKFIIVLHHYHPLLIAQWGTQWPLTCPLVFTLPCMTPHYSESVYLLAAGCSQCLYFHAHLRPVHMLRWCTAILGCWTLSHSGAIQSTTWKKKSYTQLPQPAHEVIWTIQMESVQHVAFNENWTFICNWH